MKILILGSAFNPPHLGHADTVNQNIDEFDKILLVPSYAHGFGKEMKPFEHRMELTYEFAKQFHDGTANKVEACGIEKDIYLSRDNKGPVYTYTLLSCLQNKYGAVTSLTFLMGPDNEENFHKFYKHHEIKERWNIVVAKERVLTRSSAIRPLITADKVHQAEIEAMTGKAVSDKIFENIELWV